MTTPLLELRQITVSFDGFLALRDLNLSLQPGELRAVIGPNGAGKTTFLDVITGKTAILFAAAAAAGAEVGGGSTEDIAAMHDYGMKLGLAFQIMDDALDYAADAADMGKNTGDDFADQKITMPTIIAWQQGDADERAFWQRTLGKAAFAEGDLATAQTLLAKHDAITLSLAAARDYAHQARDRVLAHCATRAAGGDDASPAIGRALADAAIFAAARSS